MSYQALARKWRPRSFSELVGQAHVVRALSNALDEDRVHHAFLFTGTRGVGKTTIARILARCLNCEEGVSSTPCGRCASCTEIDEGRHVDLIEVDAASRAKVDETRELMNNVQFAPTRARHKIYLIDEVHMFSDASFNALLKTLEEPPEHVKFLLATTDPQRMPVTVLSRCLQFSLKRLPVEEIAARIEAIMGSESVRSEPQAARMLARAADGSLRDALSLLDQAIAHGGGALEVNAVRGMLGLLDRHHVRALVTHLAEADGPALLAQVESMAGDVSDFGEALVELLVELKGIAVAQMVPEAHAGAEDDDLLFQREMAARMSAEDVQLLYQIGLIGRRDLPLAPDPRSGFEMTLLRMLAFQPGGGVAAVPAERGAVSAGAQAATGTPRAVPAAQGPAVPAADDLPPAIAPAPADEPASSAPLPEGGDDAAPDPAHGPGLAGTSDWARMAAALDLSGMARELALNCECVAVSEDTVRLRVAPQHQTLSRGRPYERFCAALQRALGRPVKVEIAIQQPDGETPAEAAQRELDERLRAAREVLEQDQGLQAIVDTFDGQIETDSVRLPR
jgi:DNA polymerase-3 subunit gamma/tau